MPIQLPASGGTAQGKTDSGASLTVSFTAKAGVERVLVVSVAGSQAGGANITGATWNSLALTLAGSYTTPDTSNRKHYAFYRLLGDSETDTTADLVVSGSGADYIGLAAQQYNGVLQTGQPDITTVVEQSTNGAGSKTTTLTTVTDHAWAVICEGGYNDTGDPEANTGTTFRVAETTYGTCGILDSGGGISPAGAASFTTSRDSTAYRISHIAIVFKPGTLQPPMRLSIDGVEQYDGDQGDGAAFRAAITAKAASGLGGTVYLRLGSATTREITFAAKWTIPANAGAVIDYGLDPVELDAVKAEGAWFDPDEDDPADWLTFRNVRVSSEPMIDMAIGAHNYHRHGVRIDYGTGTGNVAECTTPYSTLLYDTAEQDGYLVTQQPTGLKYDREAQSDRVYATGSFQTLTHNGASIHLTGFYAGRQNSTGGQGDGYAVMGHVGDGPWLVEDFFLDRTGGEAWGFGTHGQRSGAGTPGTGDPGYQNWADTLRIPLRDGFTAQRGRIWRDLADRRVLHSFSSVANGTGTKTWTVATGMSVTPGEAITANGYTAGTMTGTVTSYTSATGVLVCDITSNTGSGTGADWAITRTAITYASKNMGEFCYGQDVVLQGIDFRNFWHDAGQQYHALIFKLSTEALASLEHVVTRRFTVKYCVFRSVAQILALARYVATNNNAAISDITFEDNCCFDLGASRFGFPSTGNLFQLGLDMPVNVKINHNFFDVPLGQTSLISIGDSGSGHYSRNTLTGFEMHSNVALLSGTHSYYEISGYFGTGPTGITSPGQFLTDGCTSPVASHNSIVTGADGDGWGAHAAAQTLYAGTSGRAALQAKLRNPDDSVQADYDPRYLEGQEEDGYDGRTRGPNWSAMYEAMGPAIWPFSWVPEGSSGVAFSPAWMVAARRAPRPRAPRVRALPRIVVSRR